MNYLGEEGSIEAIEFSRSSKFSLLWQVELTIFFSPTLNFSGKMRAGGGLISFALHCNPNKGYFSPTQGI